jgi:hypothetical protein
MTAYVDALDGVIRDVVAPLAQEIDQAGRFPSEGIQALGKAGLLGLLSSKDVAGQV